MKKTHLGIIAFAAIISVLSVAIFSNIHLLTKTDNTLAAFGCGQDTGVFTMNCPTGQSFQVGTLTSNTQIYTTDNRFKFDNIPNKLKNAAYIQTPNKEIKNTTSLSWSIALSQTSTVYLLTRHIPGRNPPSWITQNYARQTNDDMSNINQYVTRKNPQGLIGEYDIYAKDFPTGTVNFNAASEQSQAYSMYIVVVVPTTTIPNPNTTPTQPSQTTQPTTQPTQPSQTNPPQTGSCPRPYSPDSPWNIAISPSAAIDPQSAGYVSNIGGNLTSNISSFTMALYYSNNSTPLKTIKLSGVYTNVTSPTTSNKQSAPSLTIPIPNGAAPATGSDSQFIIWNTQTGDEYGFWQVKSSGAGYTAVNGYHYNTNWNGVPPAGFGSRGAGVPYLTGLIRPCEIAQGHIDHAIAFANSKVSSLHVFPATKSDGSGGYPNIPEGARLQLDPNLSDSQIGCTGACLTIAHALQKYGMIVIDYSGSTKIYAEYDGSAHWNGTISSNTVSPLKLNSFRVLKLP